MTYTPAVPFESMTYRQYVIGTFTPDSSGGWMALISPNPPASIAWPLANLALYVPMYINETLTVYEGGFGTGATAGGNYDIGIYDLAGTKIVSSGTQARTASAWNTAPLTDTELTPGWYYAAMSASSTANYGGVGFSAVFCEASGICEQQTAFTLPSTATLTRTTRALLPQITFAVRSIAL